MKKILKRITAWLVKKTDYVPQLPIPIQPIIIKPEDLKKLHCQHLVDWFEWKNSHFPPDCYIKDLKYQMANRLMEEIIVKAEETPDGVMMSCDLLFKSI